MTDHTTDESQLREALLAATVDAETRGLNHNSTGNLSVRCGTNVLVTPSGIPAASTSPSDMVLVNLDGMPVYHDQARPTSELGLHLAVYRTRPAVNAIVHTHSPEATAASCTGRDLEPLHYVIAKTGSDRLRCAPYATYGTTELAHHVVATLGTECHACLMANHGAVALGVSLNAALSLAHDIEWFCGVARRATQWGTPQALPPEEIQRVATLFTTYGQTRT